VAASVVKAPRIVKLMTASARMSFKLISQVVEHNCPGVVGRAFTVSTLDAWWLPGPAAWPGTAGTSVAPANPDFF
jgi:hypothetical protein